MSLPEKVKVSSLVSHAGMTQRILGIWLMTQRYASPRMRWTSMNARVRCALMLRCSLLARHIVCVYTSVRVYILSYVRTYACMHACTYKRMHACMHTRTHTGHTTGRGGDRQYGQQHGASSVSARDSPTQGRACYMHMRARVCVCVCVCVCTCWTLCYQFRGLHRLACPHATRLTRSPRACVFCVGGSGGVCVIRSGLLAAPRPRPLRLFSCRQLSLHAIMCSAQVLMAGACSVALGPIPLVSYVISCRRVELTSLRR